jgi:hypothetical protein
MIDGEWASVLHQRLELKDEANGGNLLLLSIPFLLPREGEHVDQAGNVESRRCGKVCFALSDSCYYWHG